MNLRRYRTGDGAALFAALTSDPLALVPATDGVDGGAHVPVEPVRWAVPVGALTSLAARVRPCLPVHAGVDPAVVSAAAGAGPGAAGAGGAAAVAAAGVGAGGAAVAGGAAGAAVAAGAGTQTGAPLAPAGSELSPFLRCYRYLPGTASLPHYDKSASDGSLFSAYSVVRPGALCSSLITTLCSIVRPAIAIQTDCIFMLTT